MQEVLHNQLQDILGGLNQLDEREVATSASLPEGPYWAHIGVAREDGKQKGEYSPILYPVQHFKLLHFENTWLSPTPNKPSKGWDAKNKRILTTGVFEHRASGQRIAAFNTHLDHAGPRARHESVVIIVDTINRISRQWALRHPTAKIWERSDLPFFLAGDFNSFPTSEAYQAILASSKMVDTHNALPPSARYGPDATFTGFRPDTDKNKNDIGRIDFVFVGPKGMVQGSEGEGAPMNLKELKGHYTNGLNGAAALHKNKWRVDGYSVLPNVFDDGVFSSDHRCVVADVVLTHE
jgi:endonuclease/exonuclease/phosphatase family metal-dependent hydrolase